MDLNRLTVAELPPTAVFDTELPVALRRATAPADGLGARAARLAAPARRHYSGICNGTLGELYQGPYWEDGIPNVSVVPLPADKFVSCHFHRDDGDRGAPPERRLPDRPRCRRAVELFLSMHQLALPPGHWDYDSELEVGKGMASSTADLVATVRCLHDIFGLPYDEAVLRHILPRVERSSDSAFLPEAVLYLSGRQRVVQHLGGGVGFFACYVIENAAVDAKAAAPRLLRHYAKHRDEYLECAESMAAAFAERSAVKVARASSWSARLSQEVVPKAGYPQFARWQQEFGAAGLFVAHTGSIIGYLFTQRPSPATLGAVSAMSKRHGYTCRFGRVGWGDV